MKRQYVNNDPHVYRLTLLKTCVIGDKIYEKDSMYIGVSKGNSKEYFTGGKLPNMIISVYGRYVFKREILIKGKFNTLLLEDLEKHHIRLNNSLNKENSKGLNLVLGGYSCKAKKKEIPIYQYSLEGVLLKKWKSISKIRETNPTFNIKAIRKNLNGSYKSSHKYIWTTSPSTKVCEKLGKTSPKPVHKYSLLGEYVKSYSSLRNAAYDTYNKLTYDTLIAACCNENSKIRAVKGYMWSYIKKESLSPHQKRKGAGRKSVWQCDIEGNRMQKFSSVEEASQFIKRAHIGIRSACNGIYNFCGGYKWEWDKK